MSTVVSDSHNDNDSIANATFPRAAILLALGLPPTADLEDVQAEIGLLVAAWRDAERRGAL